MLLYAEFQTSSFWPFVHYFQEYMYFAIICDLFLQLLSLVIMPKL